MINFVLLILCLTLRHLSSQMLPLDVSAGSISADIPMDILWQIVLIWTLVWTLLVIPFAQLYYEAEDPLDPNASQIASALKIMVLGGVVFAVLAVVGYLFLSVAQVPVVELRSELLDASVLVPSSGDVSSLGEAVLSFRISIVLFLISMFTLFGTFLLACFGGIGLTALPMDLINEFRFRPTRITLEEYARRKLEMGNRATTLISIGQQIQEETRLRKKRNRSQRTTFNRFKQNVYLLEEDWTRLHSAHQNRGARVLWAYTQLVLGVLAALLSVLWVVHIALHMLPRTPGGTPQSIFNLLGEFLAWFDNATSLPLAVLFYALFAFYLLACVMKGNFKFGLRIFIIFAIHPMRVGGTMVNSFLFNVGLILMTSVAIVQFCTSAFDVYVINSAASELFGLSIQRLRYLEYFWYFYIVGMVGFAFLTLIFLLICPTDRREVSK